MPDIPISQLMDNMGMSGSVSAQDFVKALSASIIDKVGPATPYGKEKSADQKQAEQQLKKITELTEGLEELNQTLKQVKQLAEQAKKESKQSLGNFGNVGAVLNKLGGGSGKENTRLEENVFSKLARMADEAVTGHSLHVEDFHVARRLDLLIGHVRDIAAIVSRSRAGGGGGGRRIGGPAGEVGIGEIGVEREIGLMAESGEIMGRQEEALIHNKALMEQLERKTNNWAKKLGLTESEMRQILYETAELSDYDTSHILALEKALDHYGRMEKFDRRRVDHLLHEIKILKARNDEYGNVPPEKMAEKRAAFGAAAVNAGFRMEGVGFRAVLGELETFASAINRVMSYLNVGATSMDMPQMDFGPGRGMKSKNEQIRNVGQNVYQLGNQLGNILEQQGNWQADIYKTFTNMTQIAKDEGEMLENVRKIGFRAMRRGITDSRSIEAITRTSVSLGKQIGADTAQTAEELQDWVQRFRLSNTEARVLSQNIQRVGQLAGVTGDHLLGAVKNAQALAEQMRQAGNMTEGANETLIRFSAVAQRLGSTQFTRPLIEGLTSANNYLNRMTEGSRILLTRFAMSSGNAGLAMQRLVGGTTFQTPGAGMNLVRGGETFLNQLLARYGAKKVEELTAGQQGMLDRVIRAMTDNEFGLGSLRDSIETLRQTFETEEDKLDRLTRTVEGNTNMGEGQRKSIQEQIAQTRSVLENRRNMTALQSISRAMGERGTLAQGLAGAGVGRAAAEQQLRDIAARAGIQNIEQLVNEAFSSGSAFNTALDNVSKALEERRGREREAADPVTRELMIANRKQVEIQSWWERQWEELLKRIPPGTVAKLNELTGWGELAQKLIQFLAAVAGLGVLKRGLDYISGVGGAGFSGAGGTAAATGAGAAAGTSVLGPAAIGAGAGLLITGGAMEIQDRVIKTQQELIEKDLRDRMAKMRAEFDKRLSNDPEIRRTQEKINQINLDIERLLASAQQFDKEKERWKVGLQAGAEKLVGRNDEINRQNMIEKEAYEKAKELARQKKIAEQQLSQLEAQRNISAVEEEVTKLKEKVVEGRKKEADIEKELQQANESMANKPWYRSEYQFLPAVRNAERGLAAQRDYVRGLLEQINVKESGMFAARAALMFKEGMGSVKAEDRGLFQESLEKYMALRRSKGAGWDAGSDAVVQQMSKRFGVNVPELEKKVGQKQTLLSNSINAGAGVGQARKGLVDYMNRWKDEKDWTAFVTTKVNELGKTSYGSFEEAIQNASPEVIRKTLDEYTAKRGWSMETGKQLTDQLIESQKKADDANQMLKKFTEAATTPGSIYTHDIHIEPILEDIANTVDDLMGNVALVPTSLLPIAADNVELTAGNNDAMMQHRIATEFSGGDSNTSISKANQTLTEINEHGRQQVELIKQEIDILKSILARLTAPNTGAPVGDSSPNSRPTPPPNYYSFSVRPLNNPNFGGTENFARN